MRHLTEGTLRRLLDEPFTVPMGEREHVGACASCRVRLEFIARDTRAVALMLGPAGPEVNRTAALRSFHLVYPEPAGSVRRAPGIRFREGVGGIPKGRRSLRLPGVLALAAVLILGCALTPVGSVASAFLTQFQPASFRLIPVSASNLHTLPNLSDFGVMNGPAPSLQRTVGSDSGAGKLANMHIVTPATMPGAVPHGVTYRVLLPTWASFEFDATKARASVARTGHRLPPMPTEVNHSVLRISVGPVVLTRYGSPTRGEFTVPALVIVQAPQPVISSSGATVEAIERYLLSLPGIPQQVRQQIEAIGDPSVTLPIPIPIDATTADSVTIQGVQGLAIGDSTRSGSGVLWRKNGMVYAVAGAMPESEVLRVAESLR